MTYACRLSEKMVAPYHETRSPGVAVLVHPARHAALPGLACSGSELPAMKPAAHAIACSANTSRLLRSTMRSTSPHSPTANGERSVRTCWSPRSSHAIAQHRRGAGTRQQAVEPANQRPTTANKGALPGRAASRASGACRGRTHRRSRPSPPHRLRRARYLKRKQWHQPHRLGGNPPGHLAGALLAVAKGDRHLDDAKARLNRTIGGLTWKA